MTFLTKNMEHDVTPDDHNDLDAEDEEDLSEDEEIIRITVQIPIADHVCADWSLVSGIKIFKFINRNIPTYFFNWDISSINKKLLVVLNFFNFI